jgi:hypothetical protein
MDSVERRFAKLGYDRRVYGITPLTKYKKNISTRYLQRQNGTMKINRL